jgi:hypothetical protein
MSWTVAADAVMPACARAASACSPTAAKPAPARPGTVRFARRRLAGTPAAAAHEPGPLRPRSDPGRDRLCTFISPLRWLPSR